MKHLTKLALRLACGDITTGCVFPEELLINLYCLNSVVQLKAILNIIFDKNK